jgi:hypothetical protein
MMGQPAQTLIASDGGRLVFPLLPETLVRSRTADVTTTGGLLDDSSGYPRLPMPTSTARRVSSVHGARLKLQSLSAILTPITVHPWSWRILTRLPPLLNPCNVFRVCKLPT